MNIFIMLAILFANAVAITLIYQFVKKLPNKEKIIFIAASFATIYILVSVIYWISGFGIEKRINDAAKDFITFIFVPVNVIMLVPFVAAKYSKVKLGVIKQEELKKTLIIVTIVGIVILGIEGVYFKKMKQNMKILSETKQQNLQEEQNQEEQNKEINTTTNEQMKDDTNITNSEENTDSGIRANEITKNIIE